MSYTDYELAAMDRHAATRLALADHRAAHPEDIDIPAPAFPVLIERRKPQDLGRFVESEALSFFDGVWSRVEAGGFLLDAAHTEAAPRRFE